MFLKNKSENNQGLYISLKNLKFDEPLKFKKNAYSIFNNIYGYEQFRT